MGRAEKGRHLSYCRLRQPPLGASFLPMILDPAPSATQEAGGTSLTCTVAICTRGRPEVLDACLAALARSDGGITEVLVVDNAPTDDAARRVAEKWGARYCVEPRSGLSRARNTAVRQSMGEVVAYLDDDCVPEPGWARALLRPFVNDAVYAAVGAVLPTRLESDAERLQEDAMKPQRHEGTLYLDRSTPDWIVRALFGQLGTGGNMAFRRAAFDNWSGFDERLGRGALIDGCEEHYALFEIMARGFRVASIADALVRHPHRPTMSALRDRALRDRTSSAAFFLMLLVENPSVRGAVLRHVARAPRRRADRRKARRAALTPSSVVDIALHLAPRWRWMVATLGGSVLYLRVLLSRERASSNSSSSRPPSGEYEAGR